MKRIKLTRGFTALIDNEDYEKVKEYNWHIKDLKNGKKYAITHVRDFSVKSNKLKKLFMQNLIMPPPVGFLVDHKNLNPLDNRKSNLRICTTVENMRNKKKYKPLTASSKYKGVYKTRGEKKWRVRIQTGQKRIFLGVFTNQKKAALAYDIAAIKHFGEFAFLNFPNRGGSDEFK